MTSRDLEPSPTLATNERIRELIKAGKPVVHLAFGEAGLPVHPVLREMLDAAGTRNAYPPVAGTEGARAAAASYFASRGIAAGAGSIILSPGSKPMLFALLLALEGDLVLPQPSWVSYAAQAQLARKKVRWIPIPAEAGGVPDPELLREWARKRARQDTTLLVTLPDNPTGAVAGEDLLRAVCEIARENEWWLISDEIYRDLAYDQHSFKSPAELYPERTVVTCGLSKNLALGGWRIGFARFPNHEDGRRLRARVEAIASEVWSAMAGPMQEVAAFALKEPDELRDHVAASRRLHRAVTTALYQRFANRGIKVRPPAGGFYLYPDFAARSGTLAKWGVAGSAELARHLLERYNVAVLPGVAFGDEPDRLTVRLASSLLYGKTEDERWTTLSSERPAELPWVADALDKVDAALAKLS